MPFASTYPPSIQLFAYIDLLSLYYKCSYFCDDDIVQLLLFIQRQRSSNSFVDLDEMLDFWVDI